VISTLLLAANRGGGFLIISLVRPLDVGPSCAALLACDPLMQISGFANVLVSKRHKLAFQALPSEMVELGIVIIVSKSSPIENGHSKLSTMAFLLGIRYAIAAGLKGVSYQLFGN